MIKKISNSILCKVLVLLTLVNFINLSADFYTPQTLVNKHQLVDPIDTLAELVLEYFFDMDEKTIPDTEVPQEQRKFKDLKLYHQDISKIISQKIFVQQQHCNAYYLNLFESIKIETNSPPPKA
ncbi:MAG: hypothetical protein ACXIUD_13080 [Mongoliitalea sp.]